MKPETNILARIEEILCDENVTDIHLRVGDPIWYRGAGKEMIPDLEWGKSSLSEGILSEVDALLCPRSTLSEDYATNLPSGIRIRVKRARNMGTPQLFIRRLFQSPPTPKDLGIDKFFSRAFDMKPGIIWVCGPVGSGKTTFLASILSWYAQYEPCHIVTIEDPVEYIFQGEVGVVSQRQVGTDVKNFPLGIRGALREDPNIIMIGEVRDPETVLAALSAAEIGHLVFATIHAPDVAGIVERAIGMFPPGDRTEKCIRISQTFYGAVALRLASAKDGRRVWLHEVAWGDQALKNHIREGKVHQIKGSLETRRATGMHTLEQSIKEALENGLISEAEAQKHLPFTDGAL